MNYRDLLIFESVYRNGSFSIASKELNIAQPTISRTIIKIENKYNISLFIRNTKELFPTQKAVSLYELSKDTIKLYKDLENELVKNKSIQLKVSASINLHRHFIPLYTAKMKEIYPNVVLSVDSNTNDDVVNKILKNKSSLGFIDKNINHNDLIIKNYVNDPIVAVCSVDSIYANKEYFTIDELSKVNLLVRTKNHGDRDIIENIFNKKNLPFNVTLENDIGIILINASINDLGIALLPRAIPRFFYDERKIIIIKVQDSEFIQPFNYIYRKDGELNEYYFKFAEVCLSVMKEMNMM